MIEVVERKLNWDSECAWHVGPFRTPPPKWSLINLVTVRSQMFECDGVNLSEKIVLIGLCSYLIYLGSESVSQERCSCFAIGFVGLSPFSGLTGSKWEFKPRIKLFLNISVVNYKLNAFDYIFLFQGHGISEPMWTAQDWRYSSFLPRFCDNRSF